MESVLHAQIPLYIAVRLESKDKNRYFDETWLPLPATKQQFYETARMVCDSLEDLKIGYFYTTIPDLLHCDLEKSPLSVVNHLAARLNMLTEEESLKLNAIMSSIFSFDTAEQIIEYTYNTDRYTFIPGILTHWDLGWLHVKKLDFTGLPPATEKSINTRHFGLEIAHDESGWFTPLGYVASKNGWKKKPKKRRIPANLDLKGKNGEELYHEPYICDFEDIEDLLYEG